MVSEGASEGKPSIETGPELGDRLIGNAVESAPADTILATVTQSAEEVKKLWDKLQQEAEGAMPVESVWVSTYRDQIHPDYVVFHDVKQAARFAEITDRLKAGDVELNDRPALFEERGVLAGIDIESGNLKPAYRDGQWSITPDELVEDEISMSSQEDDDEWHAGQVEHFRNRDNGED